MIAASKMASAMERWDWLKKMGNILTLILKMAKNMEKRSVSMKMEIKNMKLILKMVLQTENILEKMNKEK